MRRCGCEYGGDCDRITRCELTNAIEEFEEQLLCVAEETLIWQAKYRTARNHSLILGAAAILLSVVVLA